MSIVSASSTAPRPGDRMARAAWLAQQLLGLSAVGLSGALTLLFISSAMRASSAMLLGAVALFFATLIGVLMKISGVLRFSPTMTGRDRNAVGRFGVAVQALLVAGGFAGMGFAVVPEKAAAKSPLPPVAESWHSTGASTTETISGLALVEQSASGTTLLAVHDNKGDSEKRLSLVVIKGGASIQLGPVALPDGELFSDLEAITRVPGRLEEFIVLESSGAACAIVLSPGRDAVTIRGRFKVPNAGAERQFEGFDLQSIGSRVFACWGDRGAGDVPAALFWATFDPETFAFGPVETTPLRIPWPTTHQRHVSDLRLRGDGTLLTAASSDPGDNGPFAGAIYLAGSFREVDGRLAFTPDPEPTRIFPTTEHKIEAIEFVPGKNGGLVLGADDELRGGAVFFDFGAR